MDTDAQIYYLTKYMRDELRLPEMATQWLLALWRVTQFFDDVADGEKTTRGEIDTALWGALFAMPSNGFYRENASTLLPLIAVNILKWQASDARERSGQADAVSFVWRAGFYDIVLAVVALCFPEDEAKKMAPLVASIYGEKYDEYIKEMSNA